MTNKHKINFHQLFLGMLLGVFILSPSLSSLQASAIKVCRFVVKVKPVDLQPGAIGDPWQLVVISSKYHGGHSAGNKCFSGKTLPLHVLTQEARANLKKGQKFLVQKRDIFNFIRRNGKMRPAHYVSWQMIKQIK